MTSRSEPGRAAIVGTGLIGGSLGLRSAGTRLDGDGDRLGPRACGSSPRDRGSRRGRRRPRRRDHVHRDPSLRDRRLKREEHSTVLEDTGGRDRCRRGEGRRVGLRSITRGSSGATRWRGRSRSVSTAPTPTSSSGRRGCSRRPLPPTQPHTRRSVRSSARSEPRWSRSRPSSTTRSWLSSRTSRT